MVTKFDRICFKNKKPIVKSIPFQNKLYFEDEFQVKTSDDTVLNCELKVFSLAAKEKTKIPLTFHFTESRKDAVYLFINGDQFDCYNYEIEYELND